VTTASIAYMFSADQYLGPHLGHGFIYPHLMLFCRTTTTPSWAATTGGAACRSCRTIQERRSP